MLRRRKKFLEDGYLCPMCQLGNEETRDHFFFTCPAAYQKWNILNINWNGNLPIHQRIERNDLVFNAKAPDIARWKTSFKREVVRHFPRINANLHASIQTCAFLKK
ncbi:hypothetical protein PVAP13_9NG375014 [Panicum virgatum]|uniref:Reverse transcriptase zinc-binding domain-containing protein n=1 Tax=Panicum virgatum TaxID=38727 RepID=A0A8T0MLS9_PANVG|nr:hypothetical protein PVAP13_9NG375014 [Panicum virgatum]